MFYQLMVDCMKNSDYKRYLTRWSLGDCVVLSVIGALVTPYAAHEVILGSDQTVKAYSNEQSCILSTTCVLVAAGFGKKTKNI